VGIGVRFGAVAGFATPANLAFFVELFAFPLIPLLSLTRVCGSLAHILFSANGTYPARQRIGERHNTEMADVLIAGGGIGGSILAVILGRRGLSVELFERGHFPREKPCGEGLMPAGVAVLDKLGLAEAVGGTPFYGVRYHFGGQTAEGHFPKTPGLPEAGRGQRRKHLDAVLFNAARTTPRVRTHTGAVVETPILENGRVVGLQVNGEAQRGALVVAADGVHSRIRYLLGLDTPPRRKRFGMRAHFQLAPGHEQPPWVDVFVCFGYELYVTPLPQGEVLVAALADGQSLHGPMDVEFHRWCRLQPSLASRLEGAKQITKLTAISPLAGRARAGVAPGIVLLGDAAGFLDPITGGGMLQALMTAELLADYVTDRLGTDERWRQDFERERLRMLRDYTILTRMVVRLADYPRLAERLFSALQTSPSLFSHLVGVSGGIRRLWGRAQTPWEHQPLASGSS
jgi:flavin-dependent dehydrogenase